jgi:hypothetical protein
MFYYEVVPQRKVRHIMRDYAYVLLGTAATFATLGWAIGIFA